MPPLFTRGLFKNIAPCEGLAAGWYATRLPPRRAGCTAPPAARRPSAARGTDDLKGEVQEQGQGQGQEQEHGQKTGDRHENVDKI